MSNEIAIMGLIGVTGIRHIGKFVRLNIGFKGGPSHPNQWPIKLTRAQRSRLRHPKKACRPMPTQQLKEARFGLILLMMRQ
tara:strand:+ start:589 stop:831 length:243 start_codon:yes stop_codon:yes gene_type:complete